MFRACFYASLIISTLARYLQINHFFITNAGADALVVYKSK